MGQSDISTSDYQALSKFRYEIRRYLRFSERASRDAGLEPQQHQLLLAVKGIPDGTRANIGELAERLQIQHHSTVELVDRLALRGLVTRKRTSEDRREVLIQLAPKGEKLLRELSLHHREELMNAGPALVSVLKKLLSAKGRVGTAKKAKARAKSAARS